MRGRFVTSPRRLALEFNNARAGPQIITAEQRENETIIFLCCSVIIFVSWYRLSVERRHPMGTLCLT